MKPLARYQRDASADAARVVSDAAPVIRAEPFPVLALAPTERTHAHVGQFQLLATEQQLTLDGRAEPLAAALVELKAETEPKDDRTLPLPLPGVGRQLDLPPLKQWMHACEHGRWHIHLRHKVTGVEKRVGFKCRSWRHAGECARFVASRDFARIHDAFEREQPENCTYLVLTLDQQSDAERGLTPLESYRTVTRRFQTFRQWLVRNYGAATYVATVEQHRTGWPHLNVVVSCAAFAAAIRAEKRQDGTAPGWLKSAAVRAGFGWKAWAEAPRDLEQLAGYMVKLAHRESLTGEVVKTSQLPIAAPHGTRRLRSSRAFLPAMSTKTGEYTGELLKHSLAQAQLIDAERHQTEQEAEQRRQEHMAEVAAYLLKGRAGLPPKDDREAGEAGSGAQPLLVTTGTSHTATQAESSRRRPQSPSEVVMARRLRLWSGLFGPPEPPVPT